MSLGIEAGWALRRFTPYHGHLKLLAIAFAGRGPRHFDALWDGGHIKVFTPVSLRRLLAANGFVDIQFGFAGRVPWLWKSMLAQARKPVIT